MRPFDGSLDWWRDELSALAQIVHNGHGAADGQTWRVCTRASCVRFRDVLADASAGSDAAIDRWAMRRTMALLHRSRRLPAMDAMVAIDAIKRTCFDNAQRLSKRGDD